LNIRENCGSIPLELERGGEKRNEQRESRGILNSARALGESIKGEKRNTQEGKEINNRKLWMSSEELRNKNANKAPEQKKGKEGVQLTSAENDCDKLPNFPCLDQNQRGNIEKVGRKQNFEGGLRKCLNKKGKM